MMINTLCNVIDDDYTIIITQFQKCLDSTEPVSWSTINRVIQAELGSAQVSAQFLYIDPKPLASASVAQVSILESHLAMHAAYTPQAYTVVSSSVV
jgi:predicted unusual protein kinase regulating ubiquinone biosynthesis (AarF/ABC1/UbiB family)